MIVASVRNRTFLILTTETPRHRPLMCLARMKLITNSQHHTGQFFLHVFFMLLDIAIVQSYGVGAPRLPLYATCTLEQAKEYEEDTKQGLWALLSFEVFWRDRYHFLQRKGYLFRPRFKPDWKPSWLGTNRDPDFCEDSIYSTVSVGPPLSTRF